MGYGWAPFSTVVAFHAGFRKRCSSKGGRTPRARIPAAISTAYTSGLVWPSCDGDTNPIRNAITDDSPPTVHSRLSAGARDSIQPGIRVDDLAARGGDALRQ